MKRKKLLQHKVTSSAVLLASIAAVLAITLSYFVCLHMVRARAEEMDEMFLQTAVDRTNQYLGEVSEIVNLAVSDEDFDQLVKNEDHQDQYEYMISLSNYTKYLRNMTLHYDSVDNFIYLSEHTFLAAYEENVGLYEEQIRKICESLEKSGAEKSAGSFYLLNVPGNQTGRIAVLKPLVELDNTVNGYITVVLSDRFTAQLQYAEAQVYLEDQRGTHAYLMQPAMELLDNGGIQKEDLAFPGWKLVYISQTEGITEQLTDSLWIFTAAGVAYILVAFLIAFLFGKKIVYPLKEMQFSLKTLIHRKNNGRLEQKENDRQRIVFRKRRLHFRTALMVFYTLLAVVPVLTASIGFYSVTKNIYDQKIGYLFEYRTQFLFDQIDLSVKRYWRTASELAFHEDVQQIMNHPETDISEKERNVGRVMLQKQTQNQEIMNIALFDSNLALRYSTFQNKHFMDPAYRGMLEQIQKDPYSPIWGNERSTSFHKNSITVCMTIFSMPPNENAGEKIGYILLDIDTSSLRRVIDNFEKRGNARFVLLDRQKNPVLSDNDGERMLLAEESGAKGETVEFRHDISASRWEALVEISEQEYLEEQKTLLLSSIVILTVLLILCFFFSVFSAVAVSSNIDIFIRFMRNVRNLRNGCRFAASSGDEIEQLGNSFNEMLDRLDELNRQQLAAEIEIRNAQLTAKQFELNLLQSQINPHFLYNTLKTVQYMVHVQDPRAEQMIKLLIHLFRTGISKGEKLVTVSEEIKHVKTYLEIQQIRFSGKFQVDIHLGEGTEKLYLLKLTLQPIVENAIYHGLELLDRPGMLRVEVEIKDGLVVKVEDNGNGMTQERLSLIREQLKRGGKAESIGLFNVHERIRLFFGHDYGLMVDSTFHKGTRVTLRFPYLTSPVIEHSLPREGLPPDVER